MDLSKCLYSFFNLFAKAGRSPFTIRVVFLTLIFPGRTHVFSQTNIRQDISLDMHWRTAADDSNRAAFKGFEQSAFDDAKWKVVGVPHNWDEYGGYRRMRHGNRHGYAWYRKSFSIQNKEAGKKYFLFFEGVGSYATVWLNGKKVGYHAGGRTTFTIDISAAIKGHGETNLLAVRADHPAGINDLPWVCGGCSDERGFSEGSQPMGIFRPVHLIITDDIRIEPFGVHVWNDNTASLRSASLFIETEIKNYSSRPANIELISKLVNKHGTVVAEIRSDQKIAPGNSLVIHQEPPVINRPHLWSPGDPYLYKLVSEVLQNGRPIDRVSTAYGIRTISWPVGKNAATNQFLLNGKPFFINGIAGYEHLIGTSHAFSAEQVRTRVMEVKAAGFNAFRDAHQPHNLRYQHYWDSLGILWWPQLSAHIWFDTPAFRKNFKQLLRDWIKERRNCPSVVLWGLQNESRLPAEFAKECSALIRELDPTASSQRKITTCNGGSGTDWDVPQNWTGTYGGDPATYSDDIKRQVLVGEYGAWRTLGLHTEEGYTKNGGASEDRMTAIMEMKIRLAEAAKDSAAGQFMWLLASHDNPGRVQGGEGYRELDRIGPVNYKGLFTEWGEPTDAFYMYRSNYLPNDKEPMVYIVSHTWPDKWTKPGKKKGIIVYSNCDEVELFNDVKSVSLGKRKRHGIGTHFQWDDVDIRYNVLFAVGYVKGKPVAHDKIVLHHLPPAPHFSKLSENKGSITAPRKGYHYIYRVNCGGGDYVDKNANRWLADRKRIAADQWGSRSWTNDYPEMPAFFASQRRTDDPVNGSADWKLLQSFRYGREKLGYEFPVPDGDYLVELYFIEPWLGTGGGMDCTGWRLFDVAINGRRVLNNLDIWKEAGHATALKKSIKVKVKGGLLTISFPQVASGQAVISAIAIATLNKKIKPAPSPDPLITNEELADKTMTAKWPVRDWLDTGDQQYSDQKISISKLPSALYGAQWIQCPSSGIPVKENKVLSFHVSADADVYIAMQDLPGQKPEWLNDFEDTRTAMQNDLGAIFTVYRKRFHKGETVITGSNGIGASSMYTIMAVAANNMQPAYDLKPISSYKAIDAAIFGSGIEKGKIEGKDRVIFRKASDDNAIEWTIQVGVADIYSLTIAYNNPHAEPVVAKLLLFSADETLMKEEEVSFTATRPGKSNYINTTTGTMINAGSYKVRLVSGDAEGISIKQLDVQ